MSFFKEIQTLQEQLESFGHTVYTPSEEGTGTDYSKLSPKESADLKQHFIDKHIEKIRASDAILVANYDKNGITGYIGANSFLEMGIAYALGKKIFLLNDVPQQPNSAEVCGLKPCILKHNLTQLK